MTQYIIRRILSMLGVLFVVALLTFVLMRAIPGNPFDLSAKPVPPRVLEQLAAKYNLDEPPYLQFIHYVGDIAVPRITPDVLERSILNDYLINIPIPATNYVFRWMNFGPSYRDPSRTVNDIFERHLPISFQLGVAALVVAMVIGIPFGTIAALNRNSGWDYASMTIALIGVSIPAIVSGPILRYVFGVELGWLPPTGWGTPQHVILPAFSLGFTSSAILARLTRASLLQVLNEDYIRTARAKGLSERVVITAHAMRNAMIPVVTILGPLFAALTTGTFITERIFGIAGMGTFFISSIGNRDYPVIMGTTLLFGSFLVLANLVVDIMYVWIDPRISYS